MNGWIPPFKSVAWAIILPLFLGPIGLLYGSVFGALIMGVITFVIVLLHSPVTPVLLAFAWVIGIYWSAWAVSRYNLILWAQLVSSKLG